MLSVQCLCLLSSALLIGVSHFTLVLLFYLFVNKMNSIEINRLHFHHINLFFPQVCGQMCWRLLVSQRSLLTGQSSACHQISSLDWFIVTATAHVLTAQKQILSKSILEQFLLCQLMRHTLNIFSLYSFFSSCMSGYINNTLSVAHLDDLNLRNEFSASQMITTSGLNVTSCRFVILISFLFLYKIGTGRKSFLWI